MSAYKSPPLCPKCGNPMVCHGPRMGLCPEVVSADLGLYRVEDEFHVDLIACCLRFGWEPTPANQDRATAVVADVFRKAYPGVPLDVVENTPGQGNR